MQDAVSPLPGGKGLRREISTRGPVEGLYVRLAEGASIEPLDKGSYLVDGKAYYLQLEYADGAKPQLRSSGGRQELIVPLKERLVYSVIF